MSVDFSVKYVRSNEVIGARLRADEMALLSAKRGTYYGLNSPATRIWDLIETPHSLDEICAKLQAEFDVARDVCHKQSSELLEELIAEGLCSEVDLRSQVE